jgi:hypothetical protein
MRSADSIAIMFTVTGDPNAGQALRGAPQVTRLSTSVVCAARQPATLVGHVAPCVLNLLALAVRDTVSHEE